MSEVGLRIYVLFLGFRFKRLFIGVVFICFFINTFFLYLIIINISCWVIFVVVISNFVLFVSEILRMIFGLNIVVMFRTVILLIFEFLLIRVKNLYKKDKIWKLFVGIFGKDFRKLNMVFCLFSGVCVFWYFRVMFMNFW